MIKANFTAHHDHLHANNLLKRNQRRKEQELGGTQQSEKICKSNPQALKSPTRRKPITEKKKKRRGKGLV